MSLLAHLLLVLGLTLGVQWHTADPEGVTAELWSAVPQIAAAPQGQTDGQPTPTPPQDTAAQAEQARQAQEEARQEARQQQAEAAAERATAQKAAEQKAAKAAQAAAEKAQEEREAELARERDQRAREKRQQAERDAREKEKAAQAKAAEEKAAKDKAAKEQAAKEQADKDRQAKQDQQRQAKAAEAARQDQLRRMAAQLGSPNGVAGANGAQGSTGTAQRTSGPSANYAGRLKAYIKPNIVQLDSIDGNPRAVVEVRCAPDGSIIGRRLTHSSGNHDWDETVLRAIDRTGKLPRDVDGTIPPTMEIGFTPKD
nr:cell envelope integrity protein TolA [Ideonella oryzae]